MRGPGDVGDRRGDEQLDVGALEVPRQLSQRTAREQRGTGDRERVDAQRVRLLDNSREVRPRPADAVGELVGGGDAGRDRGDDPEADEGGAVDVGGEVGDLRRRADGHDRCARRARR